MGILAGGLCGILMRGLSLGLRGVLIGDLAGSPFLFSPRSADP